MSISSDLTSQVFSLPPAERYVLAQQLLDSIDDEAAAEFDAEFVAELKRRREELIRGDEAVDWRIAPDREVIVGT
jgi:putative addiction module component (TIGR02574 family)